MKTRTSKTTSMACTIVLLALSLGAAPLPPGGSFRLTVEEVVQSDYCRVTKLKVEARPEAEMVALGCADGVHGSVALASNAKGNLREGAVTLAAVLCESNSACHVSMVLEGRPGGSSASGHRSCELASGANFASVVSITVTTGWYKLDRPLVIGQQCGQPMRLVVGRWNSEQKSEKK